MTDVKVCWEVDSWTEGAIREFDDDSSKFYQERGKSTKTIDVEVVSLKTAEDVDKLWFRQDGGADESGGFSAQIMLITTDKGEVLFSRMESRHDFWEYEDKCRQYIKNIVAGEAEVGDMDMREYPPEQPTVRGEFNILDTEDIADELVSRVAHDVLYKGRAQAKEAVEFMLRKAWSNGASWAKESQKQVVKG